MGQQRGSVALLLLVLIVVAAIAVYLLTQKGFVKSPVNLPGVNKQGPKVSLQTQYENPFDKNAQYVNPFDSYKNPFDSLK